jgi:cystathionine beta-lyase/cystathionine gamma-synthase
MTSKIQVINENTVWFWVTNPLMADIQEIAAITKKKILFCSRQYFCNALFAETIRSRADIVMHSATKYLGHSDVVAVH